MVTCTKETGLATKLKVKEVLCKSQERDTSELGKMIFNTVKERRPGLMEANMKASMKRASNKEKASSSGKMAPGTKEIWS